MRDRRERAESERQQLATFRELMLCELLRAKRPPTHEELRLLVHGFAAPAAERFCARCVAREDEVRSIDSAWLVRDDLPQEHVLRAAVGVLGDAMDEPELGIAIGVRAFDPEPDVLHGDIEGELRDARRDLVELQRMRRHGSSFDGFTDRVEPLIENRERLIAMLVAISAGRAVVDDQLSDGPNSMARKDHDSCAKVAHTGGDGARYPQPVEQAIGRERRQWWLPVQLLLRANGWSYDRIVQLLLNDGWSIPGGRMAPKLYKKHRASDVQRARLADQLRQLQSKSARN